MKYIKQFSLIAIALFIGTVSCSEFTDFEDLNVDPNSATSVSPSALLSRSQYVLFDLVHGRTLNADWGMLMVQYWAQNEYAEDSRYEQDETFFNGTWSTLYTEVLKELYTASDLIEDLDIAPAVKTNQKNIVDVMKVYAFMVLTDSWGDVPYSEAINVDFNLPGYDSQQEIYTAMLSTLATAASSFSESSASFASGDLIYNGNVTKWRKFTHSLMLRLAMRMSDVDQATAAQYITTASTNLITEPEDNAMFVFDSNPDRSNPLWKDVVLNSRDDFAVSELLVTELNSRNDPRLAAFAKESPTGGYVGMPFGLTDNEATLLKPSTSRPNDNVRAATSAAVIISSAETHFLLAEAYQRGLLSGNAETAYNNGITHSMNQWGITDATAINAYIAAQAYDASNWKRSIGTQKWFALYMSGLEAWSEHRRLDEPQLPVPAAAVLSAIPVRLAYPRSEISNNSAAVEAASSNPTSYESRLWWDVN